MNAATLFHITTRTAVEEVRPTGEYVPEGFAEAGFIHCSYGHQVIRVAEARFFGRHDLVLLEIDPSRLPVAAVEENLEGGDELFPHVYDRLPLSAVTRVHDFPCLADGRFAMPETVRVDPTMFVVFIHGPPAAGKHTVGTRVAEQLGVPLFHNHLTVDLVTTLFSFGSEPFRRLRAEIWRASFEICARAGRSFVFTFNPEATVSGKDIDALVNAVGDAGGEVRFVELVCSRASVIARLDNDSRKRFGKLTDPALFARLEADGAFEFDGQLPSDLRIDTDALDPDRAATAIVEFVRPGARRSAGA